MDIQKSFWDKTVLAADVVFTPIHISKGIINHLNPSGKCLDPCRGDGAFYNYLPSGSDFCEIKEGSDFLLYNKKIDWIIGNPPYSIFEDFLKHSFELSDNVSFLVPTNKIFQRQKIMNMINNYGGIKSMIIYGSGQLIDFPFGFSVGNFHFEKGYKGDVKLLMGMNNIFNSISL